MQMPTQDHLELDRMILSALRPQWRKTVMIIDLVGREGERRGLEIADEEIAYRITVLAAAGVIDSMGDLQNWRGSEICLKREVDS